MSREIFDTLSQSESWEESEKAAKAKRNEKNKDSSRRSAISRDPLATMTKVQAAYALKRVQPLMVVVR
jgi:hypothetical protein